MLRKATVDYIIISLSGSFPERDDPPRSFIEKRLPLPPRSLSIETFNRIIDRLIDADNLHGVIFNIDGLALPLARLQTLRGGFERLRAAGKELVVYSSHLDNGTYYLATAADKIVCPRPANFNVLGLYQEVTFLRDALKFAGIELANIQISPFKTAANNLSDQEMTKEMRAQLNWLLEDRFDQLMGGMAAGRKLEQDQIRELIDHAPYSAAEAQANGLIDEVAYEDQLQNILKGSPSKKKSDDKEKPGRAQILKWSEGRKKLRGRYHATVPDKKIAVISLEGIIAPGSSRKPPIDLPIPIIGGPVAGDRTIARLFRQVEQDKEIDGVIFYVNSRGGSALASDLMAREVERIGRKKPVVVYMGDVAASGGYYVSAPAKEIFCQPGTITGSIGVVMVRPIMDDMFDKLRMNRVALKRGEMADLLAVGPLRENQREALWEGVVEVYDQFKDVVARGRDIPKEALDPICEGRVWTGRQALERQLVDSHGSFQSALDRVIALAEIDPSPGQKVEVINIYPEKGSMPLPLPFDQPQEIWPWLYQRLNGLTGLQLLLPIQMNDE